MEPMKMTLDQKWETNIDEVKTNEEFSEATVPIIEFRDHAEKVKKSILTRIINKEYQLGMRWVDLKRHEDALDQLAENSKKKSSKSFYTFVTVNFDDVKFFNGGGGFAQNNLREAPSVLRGLILEYVENALSKVWIDKFAWCIEQRGEVEFRGPHIHMLLTSNERCKRKSQVIREFYSSFKDLVADKEKIDVRQFPEELGWTRWDYINGDKETEKMMKVENDIEFRLRYGFDSIYSNDMEWFEENCKKLE